jgi:hypothetical protein
VVSPIPSAIVGPHLYRYNMSWFSVRHFTLFMTLGSSPQPDNSGVDPRSAGFAWIVNSSPGSFLFGRRWPVEGVEQSEYFFESLRIQAH